ncbi:MAG: calcium-translocating P-type ATPase, PMCA-type [Oscillospiraceae bacterium]|nr:calcium-translocating P-type ATPase, PMCA-type [Oscillospiraceae bacterium]
MEWQTLKIEEVIKIFESTPERGFNFKEVAKQQRKFGKNILKEGKKKGFLKKVLEQFSDFMVITLLIAAAVSFVTSFINKNNDYIDSIIILTIVTFNSIIGVIQENQAEKAIDSLKKLSASYAKVIRNGRHQKILSEDLVPGDILIIETGDSIPADARIITSRNLRVEESTLTGESSSVSKNGCDILLKDTPVAEMSNMIFATSFVTSGRATAIVTQTGMETQVGKIAGMINRTQTPQTPLQLRLAKTGKVLGIATLIICAIIFILGLFQHINPLEVFMIAISLAVAAIPEGLPTVVTIALAIGVKRMAKKNAIVRRLPAVETLGRATVICADKTGTLTQNKMTVVEIRSIKGIEPEYSAVAAEIISCAALCNNSKQSAGKIMGEPTENALLDAASKIGKIKTELERKFLRVKEIPFNSSRKIMTTIHKKENNHYKVISKGAPDFLLPLCSKYLSSEKIKMIDENTVRAIKKTYESMASKALRVLAVAFKESSEEPTQAECDLIFLGLIGIIDPARPEAEASVKRCIEAGIKPVMITGDHVLTAKAIAHQLGIMTCPSCAITGKELNEMDQQTLEKNIFSYSVFARVSPEHKVRIVKAFQAGGAVVAMTGDGVNDAPALKASDIGCAMGLSGTDVAKSASDIILADDNFSSIVEAARQGRGIYENIKKTTHFLLSTNVGEIIAVFLAFVMHLPPPLIAIQLLWINFVTDSFPALALGMEPIEENIMKNRPVDSKKSLFSGSMGYNILIEGCFMGVVAILAFIIGRNLFDSDLKAPIIGQTMAFMTLGLSQLAHAFNVKSKKSIFETKILNNFKLITAIAFCAFLQVIVALVPQLNKLFMTKNLTLFQWTIVMLLASLSIVVSETEKFFARKRKIFMPKKLKKILFDDRASL